MKHWLLFLRLSVIPVLMLGSVASAADRQFSAVAAERGSELVVRVQRVPGASACAVAIEFGDGRVQSIRLEEDAAVEVAHRYEVHGARTVEVAGRTAFRGLRTMAACEGEAVKIEVGHSEPANASSGARAISHDSRARPAAPAKAGRRVALVVGNDAYRGLDLLPNSVNDARLVGDVLKRLGFEVITVADATRVELMNAIENFEARAAGADAAIFYFSGHGLQDRLRRNYLMPVDARIQGEASISGYGVDADLLLGVLERVRARVGLILLDACRDWPPGRVARVGTGKSVPLKGMSGIYPVSSPDSEVLVQFATREGESADPGAGANSPYALALAASLSKASNQPIRLMLDNVMDETLRLTGGSQRPVQFGDMRSTSYLVDPAAGTPQITLPAAIAQDELQWRRIERTSTSADLTEFIGRYPKSPYAEIARTRLNQMEERAKMDAARREELAERERSATAARAEQERLRRMREELEEERRRLRNAAATAPAPTPAQATAICDISANPKIGADWHFNACVAPAGLPVGVNCTCRSGATGINYMGVVKAAR